MRLEVLCAEGNGVIRRRDHPELATTIDRLLRTGHLTAVLPGVYAPTQIAADLDVRIAAVSAWSADAVIVGRTAASLTFWPDIEINTIDLADRIARILNAQGFRLQRRAVPVDWIKEYRTGASTLRVSAPALTAVELSDELGGDAIDRALRTRQASLDEMRAALDAIKGRVGNAKRRRLLWESRDSPWSEAERRAHQLLREAGIVGWTGNEQVLINGHRYFIDICFRSIKIAIEIDGRDHQRDIATFLGDRERQNALVLAGWTVLRFTWHDLDRNPSRFVAQVRAALAAAGR
jgi:very-short-patch-repair endonuclease